VVNRELIAVTGARSVVEPLLDNEVVAINQQADHPADATFGDAAFLCDTTMAGKAEAGIVGFICQCHQHELGRR
jgi:hypothetical protein